MPKLHTVSLGEDAFTARSGQLLLDAAMLAGVELPHDCRAGRCGACLVRLSEGITIGGETHQPGVIHACQARVFSNLAIEVEKVPPVTRVRGQVRHVVQLAEDIVEVAITPAQPMAILPGQFCRFAFRGFPARPFSPTVALDAIADDGAIRLNVKRLRDGRVTPLIGGRIKAGHALTIEGPFGHAFLRPALSNRLVLVGSGTGFAPVWAVAAAALRENPQRPIVLIAAARKVAGFYMAPAVELASRFPYVTVIPTIEELTRHHYMVAAGRALDHLPPLGPEDIVYAAGSPKLVDAVALRSASAGALLYTDPFEPAPPQATGWLETARSWLSAG